MKALLAISILYVALPAILPAEPPRLSDNPAPTFQDFPTIYGTRTESNIRIVLQGAVKHPGVYYTELNSIAELIKTAGILTPTETANCSMLNHVTVIRGTGSAEQRFTVNATVSAQEKLGNRSLKLKDGDIIHVAFSLGM